MKAYIDTNFMKPLKPKYLFKDYEENGYKEPLDYNEAFEDDALEDFLKCEELMKRVKNMDLKTAARTLKCNEEEFEFMERLFIIDRMEQDTKFCDGVVDIYNSI